MMNSSSKKIVFLGLLGLVVSFTSATCQTIGNHHFKVTFDKRTGFLSAEKKDGQLLFSGCVNAVISECEIYTSDSRNYTYHVERLTRDGQDRELLISGKDRRKRLDFKNRILLRNDIPAIQFEVVYRNVSSHDISVGSAVPIRLIDAQSGRLHFRNANQCLTNGAMYYDAGKIHDFNEPYVKPEPYGETKGGVWLDHGLDGHGTTIQSWWNISIFNGYQQESLAIGYLHNVNSLGRIQVLKNNDQHVSLSVESVFNPGFILKKSHEISSDKCAVVLGADPYAALEMYADMMAGEMNKPEAHIVNGWCNWFYTLDDFDEDEILRNAEFAARELKPYGLEYIQIDEGFQTAHGQWQGNKKFPHGLKWLCDRIKEFGLKPGIWIAPFVISENTHVFRDHPEWLVKDEDGNPVRIGPWPSENTDWYKNETPRRYCLDMTHPYAEQWFTNLVDTIVNHWGFEMMKIDFVAWTNFSARRFTNPAATPAQVYQKAMQIIRTVAGDRCHILDCGPGNVSAGFINSMRVEYDQNYGTDAAWTQYFVGNSCSAGAAGKRYFYHDKVWTNDIDHVCMDLLSLPKAQAVATLIGLSGGNVMSGDRLMNLSPAKLDVLKKILPATIEQGKPVDLLDSDPQTVFACRVKRDFGQWDVIAFFNPDLEKSVTRKFDFGRLMLDDTKTYLCFDFWNERFVGEVTKTIEVTIPPGSVSLFSLREKTAYPRIIATNRHVKQGAVEIAETHFDSLSHVLHGTSISPEGSSHSVYVYLPAMYDWFPGNGKIYEYNKNYAIRRVENNVLRIDLQFAGTDTVEWAVNFVPK
ncbi:MAG: alpha-galactosidase [Candidatus Zhuqueibacterota bacterium]